MAQHCALSDRQLEALLKNISTHIASTKEANKKFDPIKYMKDLYAHVASSRPPVEALDYVQQVPSLIFTARSLNKDIAAHLRASDVSLDTLDQLMVQFETVEGVKIAIGVDKMNIQTVLADMVEESNPTSKVTPTDSYGEVEKKDVEKRKEARKGYDARPPAALATFNQEAKTYGGFSEKDNIPDDDPLKIAYYNVIRNLNKLIGISQNANDVQMGDVKGVFLRLVKASTIPIDELYLDDQDYLSQDDDPRFPYPKSKERKLREREEENVYLVYTDRDGNPIYFDQSGNPTTKENGGKVVYTKMRKPYTDKKTGKLTLSERNVQTVDEVVKKFKGTPEEVEAYRKRVQAARDAQLLILDTSRKYINENPDELVLFSVRPGKDGYIEENYSNPIKIGDLDLGDSSFMPYYATTDNGIEQKGGVYFRINSYNLPILLVRPTFSEVSGLTDSLAEVLFGDQFTNAEKIKLIKQFTYSRDTNVYEDENGNLMFTLKDQQYAATPENKQTFIEGLNGQMLNINGEFLDKDFTNVKIQDGKVVTSIEKYNKFLATNFSTYLQPNAQNKVITLNGYNYIDLTPTTHEKLFPVEQKTEEPSAQTSLTETTPTDNSIDAFKRKLKEMQQRGDFGLKKAKGLTSEATDQQIEAARKWYDNSPLKKIIDFEQAFNIVNSDAVAEFTLAGIKLFKGSNYTDLYHEGWHVFSQLFLTKDQKTKLYNEARNLTGSFDTVDEKGNKVNVKFSKATDIQLEEFLAEDFRKYVLSKGTKIINGRPARNNIFSKIFKFLKELFKGASIKQLLLDGQATASIKGLYDNLYLGRVNEYKPSLSNVQFNLLNKGAQSLGTSENENIGLNYQDSSLLVSVIDSVMSRLLSEAEISIGSIFVKPEILSITYEQVKQQLESKRVALLEKQEAGKLSSTDEKALNILNWAIGNWGSYNDVVSGEQNGVVAYHKKRSSYISFEDRMSELSVEEIEAYLENNDEKEEGEELGKSDEQLRQEFGEGAFERKGNETSVYDMSSEETKYLIRSLPFIDPKTGKPELDIFGEPKLVKFAPTWGRIINITQGAIDKTDMYNKLVKASRFYPELKVLVERLGDPNKRVEMSDFAYVSMWGKFFQDMSVYKIPIHEIRVVDEKGAFSLDFTESSPYFKRVERVLMSQFESSPGPYKQKGTKGEMILNLERIKKDFPNEPNTAEGKIKFLRAIGFNVTDNLEMRDALSTDKILKQSIHYLYEDIVIKGGISNPMKDKNISGRRKIVFEAEAKYSGKYSNNSVENVSGDIEYDLSLNNTITQVFKELNNDEKDYSTKEMTGVVNQDHMAHLDFNNNPSVESSIILNSMFHIPIAGGSKLDHINNANKRRKVKAGEEANVKLEIINLNGIKSVFQGDTGQVAQGGIKTSELDPNSKFLMDVHTMLMDGVMELPRHAGKSSAYGAKATIVSTPYNQTRDTNQAKTPLSQHLYVSSGHFAGNNGFQHGATLLMGKLAYEMKRIALFNNGKLDSILGLNDRGGQFTIFDDILTDELKKELIEKASDTDSMAVIESEEFKQRVTDQIVAYFKNLAAENMEIYSEMPFLNNKLKQDIRKTAAIDSNAKNLSDPEVNRIAIESFTVNAFIHNTEMIGLIYGDLALYNHLKEEYHKRNAGVGSTGRIFSADRSTLNFIDNLNKGGNNYAKDQLKLPPKTASDNLNVAVFKDVSNRPSVYYDEYLNTLVAKGMDRKEAERILEPYTKMKEGDGQGWITFDMYRALSIMQSDWSDQQNELYNKIVRGELVEEGEVLQYFPPKKLQYTGPVKTKNIHAQAFHKFSVAPLVPNVIKGSNMETLHNNMVKQGFDYGVFESGSKLATVTKDGKADDFYENDDDRIIKPWDGSEETRYTPNVVYVQYLKDQVAINNTWKDKTVFSTQLRKLIINNLYEEGKPVTPEMEQMVRKFEALLDQYQEKKKEELLKEMGWKLDANGVPTGNLKTLVTFIRKEFTRQELADHVVEFIDIDPRTGKLKNDLSLSLDADKIEKLLNSIVIKRLVKQKVNGEPLIQLSGAGFEKPFRKATSEEDAMYRGTNDLPTYQPGKVIDFASKYSKFSKDKLKEALKELEGKSDTATYGSDAYRRAYNLEKQYLQDKIDGKKPKVTKVQNPTTAMKVKVAMRGDFYKLYNLRHNDGKKIGDINRLNEMVRNEEWLNKGNNRKMVTMTAVRIPVQGFNSMEFMEVYEFLPESAGNVLIPPAEIVAKSGGDFDIDKLTVFLPSLSSDINKKSITNKALKELAAKYPKLNFTRDNVNIILESVESNIEIQGDDKRIYNILEKEFIAPPKYVNYGTKGFENKIIESIREILEHPDNFEDLIRPNETELVKGVADKLGEYDIQGYNPFANKTNPTKRDSKGKRLISPTRTLEPRYNYYKLESNNIGKKTLGIGAVDNSYSALFKRIGLYLEESYSKYTMKDGKVVMKNGKPVKQIRPVNIRMKHNTVTVNGKERVSMSAIKTTTGDKVSNLISQLINGWVDIEKEAWIFNINGNNVAGPVLLFLLETGVDFKTAAHFVSQPLIVDYIKERARMSSPFYAASKGVANIQKSERAYKARIEFFKKLKIKDEKGASYIKLGDNGEYLANKDLFKAIERYNETKDYNADDLETIIKNKDRESNDAIAGLLHFIELEELTKSLTNIKLTTNVDTSPTKSALAAQEKLQKIEELEMNDVIDYNFIKKIKTNSPIASFFVQAFQLGVLRPLMEIRGSEKVNAFIIKQLKAFRNTDTFPDKEKFEATFHNDLILSIFQNYIKGVDLNNIKEYNGLPVNTTMPIKEVKLGIGAFVKDGVMYLDKDQIKKDFDELNYTGKGVYEELGLAPLKAEVFKMSSDNRVNIQEYAHFVMEREYLRDAFPIAEGQSKEAYEKDITERALRKSFNFYYNLKGGNSIANEYLSIKKEFEDLANEFSVFEFVDAFTDKSDKSFKTLKMTTGRLDVNDRNMLHENLVNLADFNYIKVEDPVANRRISNFFSRMIIFEFMRTGMNKDEYSLAPILPPTVLADLMREPIRKLKEEGGFTDEMLQSYMQNFNEQWKTSRNQKTRFRNYLSIPGRVLTTPVISSTEATDEELARIQADLKLIGENFSTFIPKAEKTKIEAALKANSNVVFMYPGNQANQREDKTLGYSSQPNSFSLPLKKNSKELLTDETYDENVRLINDALDVMENHIANGTEVAIPNIGLTTRSTTTGARQNIFENSPRTYQHFVKEMYKRFNYIVPGAEQDLGFRKVLQAGQGITDEEVRNQLIKNKTGLDVEPKQEKVTLEKGPKIISDADVAAYNKYLTKANGKLREEFFTTDTRFKEFYNPATGKREKAPQSSKWVLQDNGFYNLIDDYTGELYIENVDLKTGIKMIAPVTAPVTTEFESPTIDLSREWRGDLEKSDVYTKGGINVMRTKEAKENEHFGNPWSESGYNKTIVTKSENGIPAVTVAANNYKEWLLGTKFQDVKPQQRAWILDQINQGKLDGATLFYSGKLIGRGQGSHANSLVDVVNQLRGGIIAAPVTISNDLSSYVNHSGGAYGGDTFWDIIGRMFGVTKHKHYRESSNTSLSKTLRDAGVTAEVLTKEQMDNARAEVERLLGEKYPDTIEGNLKVRNYYQVANADSVFAIAQLANENGKAITSYLYPTIKGVTGGTNVAVQLGIKLNKPVYVWDIGMKSWFKWNGEYFVPTEVPVLTKNFAGVGSRDLESYDVKNKTTGKWEARKQYKGKELEEAAKEAIRQVYEKTANQVVIAPQPATIVKQEGPIEPLYKDKAKRVRVEYPTNIQGTSGNVMRSNDLIRMTNVSEETEIEVPEEIEDEYDYLEGLYGESVANLWAEDIGVSIEQAEFLRDNPEFAEKLADSFIDDESADGLTIQQYAQSLLNKNEKLIDGAQLSLFTGFTNTKEFTNEEKAIIIGNFAAKHKMTRETAADYINTGMAVDVKKTIDKLKECYL